MRFIFLFIFSFSFIFQVQAMFPEGDGSGERPCKRARVERGKSEEALPQGQALQTPRTGQEIREEQEYFPGFLAIVDEIETVVQAYISNFSSSEASCEDTASSSSQTSSSEDEGDESLPSSQASLPMESKNENNSISSPLITRLSSLSEHRDFIRDAFENAQDRIIFCSPFLSFISGFTIDFTKERILKALERGVEVKFVLRRKQRDVKKLERYFASPIMSHANFRIVRKNNFHFKTAVVDHKMTEGSFNWLSACRDKRKRYHNHEATFVYEGAEAEGFINEFLECLEE